MKEHSNQRGLILAEIIVVIAILGFFALALSGLLRAITIAGRNLPTSGRTQTYQQVVEQINVFLIELSRDTREAKRLETRSGSSCPDPGYSECLLIHRDEGAFITYGYCENEKTVKREGEVVIRGVHKEDSQSQIFQVVNDSSVIVTLPVRCLSQSQKGGIVSETHVFSFTVERRLSPVSSHLP